MGTQEEVLMLYRSCKWKVVLPKIKLTSTQLNKGKHSYTCAFIF